MLYGTEPTEPLPAVLQPLAPDKPVDVPKPVDTGQRNAFGEKIMNSVNTVGTVWNTDTHEWEQHQMPALVPVEKSFYQDRTFADGSTTRGGYFYTPEGIPDKGFEQRIAFVPTEDRPVLREGIEGGLNRTMTQKEFETGADATDPYYVEKKRKKIGWPFMYVAGEK